MKRHAMATCLLMAALGVCAQTQEQEQSAGDKPAGSGSHLHTCHKQHTGGIHQYRQRTTEKTEFRTRPAVSVEYDTLRHYYQRCRCRGWVTPH